MPPRNDMAMDSDPAVAVAVSSSERPHRRSHKSNTEGKHRSRSSKKPRGSSSRRSGKQQPQDDKRERSQQRSTGKDEKETQLKKGHKVKSKKSKKSKKKKNVHEMTSSGVGGKNSSANRPVSPPSNDKVKRCEKAEAEGVTVSQFMTGQQEKQDEASARKKSSIRQKLIREQQEAMGIGVPHQPREDSSHYFDEESDRDESEAGAVVARKVDRPSVAVPQSHVVDAVPADHPASSIIQTLRTCSLCHRTLPRAQFSERDRFSVNLSLAAGGATCRTCSMTVCAVRLKSIPNTERLLLEYAQKGLRQGTMLGPGGVPIAGFLESSDDNLDGSRDSNALVLRQNSTGSGITGKELTLYGGTPTTDGEGNNNNIMGMAANDVNSAFSGQQYGHGEGDRPANVANCKYIDALLRMPSYLNLNAFGLFKSSAEASMSLAALEAVRVYGTLDKGYFVPHDCDGEQVVERSLETADATVGDEEPKNPASIVCLVLNEGPVPRTAVLASQHYGWTTLSVDPQLSDEWDGYHDDIPGFTGYSGSISDFMDSAGESMVEFRHQSVGHLIIIGIQTERDSLRLKSNGHINEIRRRYEDVPTTLVSLSPVRKATLAPQRRSGQCGSKLEKDIGYEPNCSYIDEGVFSECRLVEVWNFHNAEDEDGEEDGGEYSEDDGTEEGSYSRRGSVDDNSTMTSDYVQTNRGTDQKQGKMSEWLEDRVAEYKKAQDSSSDVEKKEDLDVYEQGRVGEENTGEEECCEAMDSPGTSSTRGDAIDRRLPQDSGSRVDSAQEKQEHNESCCDTTDRDNNYQMAEHHPIADPGNSQEQNDDEALWSPPDETEMNQVWGKAMEKQHEQETFVNQFEEYYESKENSGNENDSNHTTNDAKHSSIQQQSINQHGNPNGEPLGHYDEGWDKKSNDVEQEDPYEYQENAEESHGLPPGWEAILDPASGDYYYTNWDTGEVTWDHPLEPDHGHPEEQHSLEEEEVNATAEDSTKNGVYSQNETIKAVGHADDQLDMDSDVASRPFDVAANLHADHDPVAATRNDSSNETPPLVQCDSNHHSNFIQNDEKNCDFGDIDASDCDSSAYLFDDQSSASSAIGALARWNKPLAPNSGKSSESAILGKTSSHSGIREDDVDGWSDDEDEGIGTPVGEKMERSQSSMSQKRQPWHKDSETENNDSFYLD